MESSSESFSLCAFILEQKTSKFIRDGCKWTSETPHSEYRDKININKTQFQCVLNSFVICERAPESLRVGLCFVGLSPQRARSRGLARSSLLELIDPFGWRRKKKKKKEVKRVISSCLIPFWDHLPAYYGSTPYLEAKHAAPGISGPILRLLLLLSNLLVGGHRVLKSAQKLSYYIQKWERERAESLRTLWINARKFKCAKLTTSQITLQCVFFYFFFSLKTVRWKNRKILAGYNK